MGNLRFQDQPTLVRTIAKAASFRPAGRCAGMDAIEPMEAKNADTLPEGIGWQWPEKRPEQCTMEKIGEEAQSAMADEAIAGAW